MTGLVISVTALGHAKKDAIVRRSGAGQNDLICITGNLGAAYMGLQLLERERRVLSEVENPQPKFEGYEYLLEKYLKPPSPHGYRRDSRRRKYPPYVDD